MERPSSLPPPGMPSWDFVGSLLNDRSAEEVRAFVAALDPADVPRLLSRLEPDERSSLLALLDPETSAHLLEHLVDAQSAEFLHDLEPSVAAGIIDTLRSNDQADLLAALDPESANAVLSCMPKAHAEEVKRLAQYSEDTAGGIMITEYVSFEEGLTVGDVLDELRANVDKYQKHDVQYIYVEGPNGLLKGVLRLRDLVLTQATVPVRDITIEEIASVHVDASLAELEDFFDSNPYRGVPVVDADGRLTGIVRHADVAEALGEQAASDHLKAQGIVGGEELRTMPVLTRSWRRLSWLSINIVLNVAAASVIAFYEETLSQVIILAVFLPIISDMSGCSGNQAVAVSMRELTLGVVRPADAWLVWKKELSVGLINATALGIVLGGVAFLWKGNLALSLVVGSALAINTVVAVSLGGLVPLFLRGLRLDPALASGPILTTVTDMCGFLLVLSLASAVLPMLTGM